MATYDELIAKARELHAAGRTADAKRVAQIAIARRDGAASREVAPDQDPSIWENAWGKGAIDTPGERAGEVFTDMSKSLVAGTARGVAGLGGLPGSVGDLIDSGVTSAANMAFGTELQPTKSALSGAALQGYLSDATGGASEYRGQTTAGKYAGTVGEFLPGAALGGVNPANLIKYGVVPGAASEAAGQATEGTAAEPYARVGAALAAPMALSGVSRSLRKVVTPNPTDPARLEAARTLQKVGVHPTAGQITGNPNLKAAEAATTRGPQMMTEQADAFTRHALKSVGSTATRATPAVMRGIFKRLGREFDDLAAANNITVDRAAIDDLMRLTDDYLANTSKSNLVPAIKTQSGKIVAAYKAGKPITGAAYQKFRTSLGSLTKSADGSTRDAAIAMRDTLDDALERTLQAAGNTKDLERFATVRNQYRNILPIERAVTSAGSDAALGLIKPSQMRTALAGQSRRGYATGKGDLEPVTRAGQALLAPLPQSGTTPRLMAAGAPAGSSVVGGAIGFGLSGGNPIGAAVGSTLGAMSPRAVNALKMTPQGQKYLANQLATGSGSQILDKRLLATLATASQQSNR